MNSYYRFHVSDLKLMKTDEAGIYWIREELEKLAPNDAIRLSRLTTILQRLIGIWIARKTPFLRWLHMQRGLRGLMKTLTRLGGCALSSC